jgi:hypothetical protein
MKIMKGILCCQQAKGTLQVILYTGWLIIASLLPSLGYTTGYLSPVAAVVIFLLVFGCCFMQ